MIDSWSLEEWNEYFYKRLHPDRPYPPMTSLEIANAILFLRNNNYPKPKDCPGIDCPKYRPACQLGVCVIAVGMCGDF